MTSLYLLDTSALSELAPGRRVIEQGVLDWFDQREPLSYISVITLLELERGVAKLKRQGHTARAVALSTWVDTLLAQFGQRIIAINQTTAQCAGQLEDQAIGRGYSPGLADALIGATAMTHDGVVITRNIRHFKQLGVDCIDPFASSS